MDLNVKNMLNNKKYITLIEVFLVLYVIAGGFFIFKIINDRIKYLSRNNPIDAAYIDVPIDDIKESFILKNQKIKLNDNLISENVDTLQLDRVVDKNNTKSFLSSSYLGCNECASIQFKTVDELNYSMDANVNIILKKQSRQETSLYERMNKIKSVFYPYSFNKDLNDMLLGVPIILKMYKEFSVIDIFKSINPLP